MRAPLPTWAEVDTEATRLRREVGERLRQWGAVLHARGRHRGLPSRWLAAFDSTQRPYRSRLAQIDNTSTDRDQAEAAADDLWDAVAQSWCLVTWANAERLEHAPPVEHLIAELHAAGRWLASYPVALAGHDAAIAELFSAQVVAPS